MFLKYIIKNSWVSTTRDEQQYAIILVNTKFMKAPILLFETFYTAKYKISK